MYSLVACKLINICKKLGLEPFDYLFIVGYMTFHHIYIYFVKVNVLVFDVRKRVLEAWI